MCLGQLGALKGQQRQLLSSAERKCFFKPQNPCHLLKIHTKQVGISGRTREHKAKTFTLIQAPGVRDVICSLALCSYKSELTFKRRPVLYPHLTEGETKPGEVG